MVNRLIRAQRGQTLVTVALLMVVFMGFLALAIDVGLLLSERLRMQNAADAGALAGAREICLEPQMYGGDWNAAAQDYAVTRNLAPAADVTLDGGVVTVHTRSWVDLIFANVFGIDTVHVDAVAAAACGEADRGVGGLWPLSLEIHEYDELGCDDLFYVFTDDTDIDCDECVCEVTIPGGGTPRKIGPGQRGWLRLFEPPLPFPDPCPNHNCGENEMACWIQNDHPGPVSYCDRIPGQPGVVAAAKPVINGRMNDIVNIVLWDDSLVCSEPPLGTCPGTLYPVAGFGCIKILGWHVVDFPEKPLTEKPKYCAKNVKIILAQKQCPCESYSGGTDGQPPAVDRVSSVSLIQ